jgi:hypothetical protein
VLPVLASSGRYIDMLVGLGLRLSAKRHVARSERFSQSTAVGLQLVGTFGNAPGIEEGMEAGPLRRSLKVRSAWLCSIIWSTTQYL